MSKDIFEQALEVVKASDANAPKPPMVRCAEVLVEIRKWQQTGKLPPLFCQGYLQAVSQHTSPSGDVFWLARFILDVESCFTGNLLLAEQAGNLVPIVTEALIANAGGTQA